MLGVASAAVVPSGWEVGGGTGGCGSIHGRISLVLEEIARVAVRGPYRFGSDLAVVCLALPAKVYVTDLNVGGLQTPECGYRARVRLALVPGAWWEEGVGSFRFRRWPDGGRPRKRPRREENSLPQIQRADLGRTGRSEEAEAAGKAAGAAAGRE